MKKSPESIETREPVFYGAFYAAVAFAFGITVSSVTDIPLYLSITGAVALSVFLIIFRERPWIGDTLGVSAFFLAGAVAFTSGQQLDSNLFIEDSLLNKPIRITGKVSGNVRYGENYTCFPLKTSSLSFSGTTIKRAGVITCVLKEKNFAVTGGAFVEMRGVINETKDYRNLKPEQPAKRYFRFTADNTPLSFALLKTSGNPFTYVRDALSGKLADIYPGKNYGIFKAMTFGDLRELPADARTSFARSGIAHILAVSGQNVGMILLGAGFILGMFYVRRTLKVAILLAAIFIYTGICGFQPPVLRAFVMAGIVMSAYFFGRMQSPENSLYVALIAILAFDPGALFGPSLQLSFTAVWGIIKFYNPARSFINPVLPKNRISGGIADIVIISGIAGIITAPLIAFYFGTVPLLSIPANLIAVPLATVVVDSGTAAFLLLPFGKLFYPLTFIFLSAADFSIRIIDAISGFISAKSWSVAEVGDFSYFGLIVFYSWLFIAAVSRGNAMFKKLTLYMPLVFIAIYIWFPVLSEKSGKISDSFVVFLDVGQGDSTLIKDGPYAFLVDTGNTNASVSESLCDKISGYGVRKIDGLFISHMHDDHTGGLERIAKRFKIENIFCCETDADSLRKIYGPIVTGIDAGDSISFGKDGMVVLMPQINGPSHTKEKDSDENDSSLVFRFDIHGERILFTGDIENESQRRILCWGDRVKSEILKVPHHGSNHIEKEFISDVSPETSVISCGLNNKHGHPGAKCLSVLTACRSAVKRTDMDGDIFVRLNSNLNTR